METPTTYYFHHTNGGFLQITGEDRLDFVQRQTTNDVEQLGPGKILSTVLTNPSARIIDVLQLFQQSEDSLGAITLPGRGAETALFLKRRVFFMDRVTIRDASTDVAIVDLEGQQVEAVLEKLGLPFPGDGVLVTGNIRETPVIAAGQKGPVEPSVRFLVPAADLDRTLSALQEAGAAPISAEAYESLRVVAGLPGWEGELTDAFTPLETNLDDLISATKGCYTGQEVLARQITYDKITRSLAGVQLESPVSPGAKVLVDGQNVGEITSFALSPGRRPIALAVLRRPHDTPGTRVAIEQNGGMVAGEVTQLPFKPE